MVLTKIRENIVDGVGPWEWLYEDEGAWEGPVNDWINYHKPFISRLRNKRLVIQAGGNQGLYPVLLSKMFESVITAEPDYENHYVLMQNLSKHKAYNIWTEEAALGEYERLVYMQILDPTNAGMHQIVDNLPGGDINMTTIDIILEKYRNATKKNIPVDLIFLDIEGYEFHAIKGALKTIEENEPVIGLERPNSEVVQLLESFGYKNHQQSCMDTFFWKYDHQLI